MLQDTRIIQRHCAHEVIAECQHIVLRDSSVLTLHLVLRHQVEDTFLRAMLYDETHWCVFDLRAIDKLFAVDIPALPRRDTPGIVLHTLRGKFDTLAEFQAKALLNSIHVWITDAPTLVNPRNHHPRGAGVVLQPSLGASA